MTTAPITARITKVKIKNLQETIDNAKLEGLTLLEGQKLINEAKAEIRDLDLEVSTTTKLHEPYPIQARIAKAKKTPLSNLEGHRTEAR